MKRVLKYATGDEIPDNAVYLSTQVETDTFMTKQNEDDINPVVESQRNKFVWHYFLVEIADRAVNRYDGAEYAPRVGKGFSILK